MRRRNFHNIIILSGLLGLLWSCQVNYPLLQPWRNSITDRSFSWREGQDSIKLNVLGDDLRPVFFKNNDTLKNKYNIKSVYFDTSSGRKINGWLLSPKESQARIAVFALHGNSGNLISQFRNFAPLTEYGYSVFLFDYAGFGYSEGEATRKNAQEDSFAAFDYFSKMKEFVGVKKIIYGQSMGGNFAIPVAEKYQSQIEGLVLEGTMLNADDIAAHYLPVAGKILVKNNVNNQELLKKFHKPVLVIHSSDDRVVPFKLGKKLFEKVNAPKLFLTIKKSHLLGPQLYSKEITDQINTLFLAQ